MRWDPEQYTRFADHRERPFHDLVGRVGAQAPARVLDVGCGPGTATVTLTARWPEARIEGVDVSEEMIAAAGALSTERLGFRVADAHDVDVSGADVVLSNAMLQWLPDHRELLDAWAAALRPGAWLGFQVPGNFEAPSHRLLREVAARGPWAHRLRGVLRGGETVSDPADYAGRLLDAGFRVDAWETTYVQWLTGEDPVLEWMRGTALRPVLARLAPEEFARFEEEYAAGLRAAYPARRLPDGTALTALEFRRVFVVGLKA